VFDSLAKLQSLSLANNKMTVLNFDNFLYNEQLMSLKMSSNQLTTLLALNDKMKLRTLLLDHNNLTDISVLQQLPWLTSLDVSANQLTDLETVNFPALKEIDISQNFWDCKYLDKLLRNLRANKISTPVKKTEKEVLNTPNVNRIGCFDAPPVG
jgi:Leucine-rich repeat (LRR) protein